MSGLTRTEAAIMDLWDEGQNTRLIARALGLNRAAVQRVVSRYHDGPDYARHCAAMAESSSQLRRAIESVGGCHIAKNHMDGGGS